MKYQFFISSQIYLMPLFCLNTMAMDSSRHIEKTRNNKVILSLDHTENESLIDLILMGGDEVQGSVALALDDGTAESSVGAGGQFLWLNRFTPSPAEFPFNLEEVSVVFGTVGVAVGQDIKIFIFEDTDEDGNPGTGAHLLASFDETIQVADQITFNVYPLNPPVQLNGPGDVLIGIANKTSFQGNNDLPAAIDETSSQIRSWAATYLVGHVPDNPPLPSDQQWGTIDSLGFPGNWLLRGAGTNDLIFSNGFE